MTPVLDIACESHPGRVRAHNEDCVAADADAGFAVLADGMGGHQAGEVASRIAVDIVRAGLQGAVRGAGHTADVEALIAEQIGSANLAIYHAARRDSRLHGMGTTVVAALWHNDVVSFGHIGDSRLYRLRGGAMARLTRDHSLVQERLDAGRLTEAQARLAPYRNILTRAVGTDPAVQPDVRSAPIQREDLYLLCSDGLTDMLRDDEIEEMLRACGTATGTAAAALVERANGEGGMDNISVILVRVVRCTDSSQP